MASNNRDDQVCRLLLLFMLEQRQQRRRRRGALDSLTAMTITATAAIIIIEYFEYHFMIRITNVRLIIFALIVSQRMLLSVLCFCYEVGGMSIFMLTCSEGWFCIAIPKNNNTYRYIVFPWFVSLMVFACASPRFAVLRIFCRFERIGEFNIFSTENKFYYLNRNWETYFLSFQSFWMSFLGFPII